MLENVFEDIKDTQKPDKLYSMKAKARLNYAKAEIPNLNRNKRRKNVQLKTITSVPSCTMNLSDMPSKHF